MNFFCVENVPNSGYVQFQEEGKVGCLFAGGNHVAHSRQFQRRKEKSRLAENVARFTEVHSNPSLRDDKNVVDPIFWTRKRPFLRWWAALKIEESQCPKPARVTHPA